MRKQLTNVLQIIQFRYLLLAILFVAAICQFLIMAGNVRGTTYDIQLLQLAPETIRSVKTIEDTVKTERDRDQAEKLVEPVYTFNEELADHRAAIITSVFDIVLDVRKETKDEPIEKRIEKLKESLKGISESQTTFNMSNAQLEALLTIEEPLLITMRDQLASLVAISLEKPFRKEQVLTVRNELDSKIRQQQVEAEQLLNTAITLGRAAIVETETLDEEKTALRIRQARDFVEPTRILQGQIIVQEGELVDREIYRQLELLGMLDSESSSKPLVGISLLIVLQMAFLFIVFERSQKPVAKKRNELLVTIIVYMICLIMMKILSAVAHNFDVMIGFLFPTAFATMLVRLLVNDRTAAIVTILTAASAGVMFHSGFASILQMDIALYIVFGGFSTLYFMRSLEKRAALLQACGILAVVHALFVSFYLLMAQSDFSLAEVGFYYTAAIFAALLSGALTMGLLPFFESAFGILSTVRLIELSNPNHPLLRKLLTETPGTYHHSIMVANLAETACEAIGADGLLARVGCYYHDLGKTMRPSFFIENQMGNANPHDVLAPQKSANIIIAHTTDGAKLLQKHKMPQEIIDIALQHHGTSLLKFFVFKAKEQGEEVNEATFRYPGPKPRTKEAAVISIADSVEAAVRSMKEPTPEKIKKLVQSIIQDRIQDHQFDDCDISLKELKVIEDVLCETLNGTFHSRIEYPK